MIALAYNGLRQVEARDEYHVPLLRRALGAIETVPDASSLRARLLAHLAHALDENSTERDAAAELAADLADVDGDPRAVYESRIALFWVRFVDPSRASEAYAAARAALDAARLVGDPEMLLHAIQCLVVAGSQVSDHAAVAAAVNEALALGASVGSPWNKALPLLFEGRLLLAAGRIEDAEKKVAATIEASAFEPTVMNLTGAQLILIYRWQRRLADALGLIGLGDRGIPPEQRQLLDLIRGCVLADDGSGPARSEARELLASALRYLAPTGAWQRSAELVLLADGAATLDDADLAAAVRPLLQPWARLELQIMVATSYGPCRLYLGRLDRVLGELDRAVDELERACDGAERDGLRSWSTLAKADSPRSLRTRRRRRRSTRRHARSRRSR